MPNFSHQTRMEPSQSRLFHSPNRVEHVEQVQMRNMGHGDNIYDEAPSSDFSDEDEEFDGRVKPHDPPLPTRVERTKKRV